MIINFSDINFPLNLQNEKNNNYLQRLYVNNKVKYSLNIKNLHKCLKNGNNIRNKGNIIKLLRLYKDNLYDSMSYNINEATNIDNIKTRNNISFYHNDILKLNENLYFNLQNNRFYLQRPNKESIILDCIHFISNNINILEDILNILPRTFNSKQIKYKHYQEMGIYHKYKIMTNTNLIITNGFLANNWKFKKICKISQIKKMKIRDLMNIDTLLITYECIKHIINENKLFFNENSMLDKSIEICHRKDILNHSCYFFFVIYWNNIIFDNINTVTNNKLLEFLPYLQCKTKYLLSNSIDNNILKTSFNIATNNKYQNAINNDLYKKYIDKHVFKIPMINNKNICYNLIKINNEFENIFHGFFNEYYGENMYDNNLQIIYSLINIHNSNIIKNILISKDKLKKFYENKGISYNDTVFQCKDTKCSICYTNHPIDNYCFLHCGHNYCTSCFINILNFNNYQCPMCRHKFNYQEYFILNNDIKDNFNKINECMRLINGIDSNCIIISKWKNVINEYMNIFNQNGIKCGIITKISKFNSGKFKVCFMTNNYLDYNYKINCSNFIILDPFCIDRKGKLINEIKNKSLSDTVNITILYTSETIEEKYVDIIRDLI